MRILVVEDDPALRLGLKRTLLAEGWQVDAVEDGELALSATATASYDLAVLDLNLPRRDGIHVLMSWRESHQNHPVLILSARDELQDRVRGLNGGADDYLIKPFEPSELVARIRAIARRRFGNSINLLQVGNLVLDAQTRELRCHDQEISLTPRERALMELLMASGEKPVPKSRIISTMSSWESDFSANAVEIYILKLRRKLEHSGVSILTVRGVGYALKVLE
jgi:two-component system OmpR family response regulator